MFRESGPFHKRTSSNDKMEQMTKQEQLIEQKKLEIQMKIAEKKRKETEEALKKIHSTTGSINKKESLLNSRNRWRKRITPNVVENTSGLTNIFSNDGSFLEQFKKLSGAKSNGSHQGGDDAATEEGKNGSSNVLDSDEASRLQGDGDQHTNKLDRNDGSVLDNLNKNHHHHHHQERQQYDRDYNKRRERNQYGGRSEPPYWNNNGNEFRYSVTHVGSTGSSPGLPPPPQPVCVPPPPLAALPPPPHMPPNFFNNGFPSGVPPPNLAMPPSPYNQAGGAGFPPPPPPPPLPPNMFPPPALIPAPSPLHPHSIPAPSPLHPHSIPAPSPLHPHSIPAPSPLHPHTIPAPSPLHPHSIPFPSPLLPQAIPPPPLPSSGVGRQQDTWVVPPPVLPTDGNIKMAEKQSSSVLPTEASDASLTSPMPDDIPVPAAKHQQTGLALTNNNCDDLNQKLQPMTTERDDERDTVLPDSSPTSSTNSPGRRRRHRSKEDEDSSSSSSSSRSSSSSSSRWHSDDKGGGGGCPRRRARKQRSTRRRSPSASSEDDEERRMERKPPPVQRARGWSEDEEEEVGKKKWSPPNREEVKVAGDCGGSFEAKVKQEVKEEEAIISDIDGVPMPFEDNGKNEFSTTEKMELPPFLFQPEVKTEKFEFPPFLFQPEVKKEVSEGEEDAAARRIRKRRSRWGEVAGSATTTTTASGSGMMTDVGLASIPTPPPPLPPPPPIGVVMPTALGASIPTAHVPTINVPGMKGAMISQVTRTDPALLQYAMQNFGSTQLSEEDWKKAEDHFKINLLYQDMMKKREELARLEAAGKHRYEYDSDEETEGGTWEHRLREKEMEATQLWADGLTEAAKGKHHIGDFLPPDELKQFMEKYEALKQGRPPDLSDYKEYKLKEDNIGFQMLQKLGWTEGQGLGSDGSGILDPVNKATTRGENQGLGVERPDDVSVNDDEYDAYRKRMMLAYRFRPNPLNNPRRPYY